MLMMSLILSVPYNRHPHQDGGNHHDLAFVNVLGGGSCPDRAFEDVLGNSADLVISLQLCAVAAHVVGVDEMDFHGSVPLVKIVAVVAPYLVAVADLDGSVLLKSVPAVAAPFVVAVVVADVHRILAVVAVDVPVMRRKNKRYCYYTI